MNQSLRSNIKIVLVEPAGALNVDLITRIMKNMGLNPIDKGYLCGLTGGLRDKETGGEINT